jgi:hypothetical protein
MVIDDLDVPWAIVSPAEADSPLVVNANAVLSAPVTTKFLEPVARWHAQVVQILGAIEHLKLPFGLYLERPELPRGTAAEKLFRISRRE